MRPPRRIQQFFATVTATLALLIAATLDTPSHAAETRNLLDLVNNPVELAPTSDQVSAEPGMSGTGTALIFAINPGKDGHPGVGIRPPADTPNGVWDLSDFGHVVAEVTNTGEKAVRLHVRVDNPGDWRKNPWNTEARHVKPGETRRIKVIFGHAYGYKPSYKLDPSKVSQVLLFTGKSKHAVRLRVNSITAGGSPGEKPAVNPARVRVTPKDGFMLGQGVDAKNQLKVVGKDFTTETDGQSVSIGFKNAGSHIGVKPDLGMWRLADFIQVEVTVTNTGDTPVTPLASLRSNKSVSAEAKADAAIAPGASTTVTVPFSSGIPWRGPTGDLPRGHLKGDPKTGNRVESDRIDAVKLRLKEGVGSLRIDAIRATAPPIQLPEWVGKRPPVSGDWVMTFRDEFDAPEIDQSVWNIYTANYWDRRSHFTKDNVILKDGKVHLRYEKKRGMMNDNPNDKHPATGKNVTDYAVGYLDTYGKWTQTYGYFEARMKLPEAPGLWPAFWTMPDRGVKTDPRWKNQMTEFGGMEFDIMEHLTRWGPHRFNVAFHWDGYGKNHKATGTTDVYVPHDDEGFITTGLLWLPGKAVVYAQGQEIARWEHERICSIPSYLIFYMVSGGWDNNALDDKQLPADFVVDYIRVWQRQDFMEQ